MSAFHHLLRPNILVTGTPGLSKTRFSALLKSRLGLAGINLGEFTRENDLMEELYESDEKDMQDMLEEKLGEGGHVVDHDDMHYATNQDRRKKYGLQFLPKRWFDLVLVLRSHETFLHDETFLKEIRLAYSEDVVMELHSREEHLEANLARVEQWLADRGNVRPSKRRSVEWRGGGGMGKKRSMEEQRGGR